MDKSIIISYFKLNEKERQEHYLATNGLAFLRKGLFAVGYTHFVTLQDDGTVAAFGNNEYGQCNVGGWRNIVKVAAGDFHTAALKSDGTVYATGDNTYGQCNVAEWRDITDIFADKGFTVGVTADGKIMATHEAKTAPQQKAPASIASVPTKAGQMYDQTEKPVSDVYNDFEYVITGGKASITKYKGNAETVVIPEVIDGVPVRCIGKKAFYSKGLSSLILSQNLREIGGYAFWYCEKLSKIVMPYGVETIGNDAFLNCDIEELILPESVKTIGDAAFRFNFNLRKLVIPDSVETIGDLAFPSVARSQTEISAETKKRLKNYYNIFG